MALPVSEALWWTEVAAFRPQAQDEPADDLYGNLDDYRAWLKETAPHFDRDRLRWESYVLSARLWLVLEQCSWEGGLLEAHEFALQLDGCPHSLRASFEGFLQHCPPPVADYLAMRYFELVRNVRLRLTGQADWQRPAASGSAEMLASLMFKWGPRHTRHRWTW